MDHEPPPLLNKSLYLAPDTPEYTRQKAFDDGLRDVIGNAIDEPHMKAIRLRELLRQKKVKLSGFRVLALDQ